MSAPKKPLRETALAKRVVSLAEALLDTPEDVLRAMGKDLEAHLPPGVELRKVHLLAVGILERAWWDAPTTDAKVVP